MKIIKYYRKSAWGVMREYIHPDNISEKTILFNLTQKETINEFIRSQIENLTNRAVTFHEVLAPEEL